MSVCEDYGYIAKRLREIQDEALYAAADTQRSSGEAQSQTPRSTDFDGWFWQLVGATG